MPRIEIDGVKIKQLHEQGLNRKEIAAELGYPMAAVNIAFKTLELKRVKTVYVVTTEPAVDIADRLPEPSIENEDESSNDQKDEQL